MSDLIVWKPGIGVSVRVYVPAGSPVMVTSFSATVSHLISFVLSVLSGVTPSTFTLEISFSDVRVNFAPFILFPRTSYLANVIGTVC